MIFGVRIIYNTYENKVKICQIIKIGNRQTLNFDKKKNLKNAT